MYLDYTFLCSKYSQSRALSTHLCVFMLLSPSTICFHAIDPHPKDAKDEIEKQDIV